MKNILVLLFSLSFFPQAFSQVNLENGLVAWLPFTGNTADASVNGNNGFPENGPVYTTDRFGNANNAILLDGVNDFIRIPDGNRQFSTTPFSVSVWFQVQQERLQVLVGKRDYGPNNGQQFQVALFRPSPAGVASAVISDEITCPTDLRDEVISISNYPEPFCIENWHSLVVTFDGVWHRLYFDGELVSENRAPFPRMLSCTSDIRIGNWWSGDPLPFQGKVDDFRWYNRVLTRDEIALLSAGSGIQGGVDFHMRSLSTCDNNSFQFFAMGQNLANARWDFGDGATANGITSPTHVYALQDVYQVRLITGAGPGCLDTIVKPVDTRIGHQDFLMNRDTTVCVGSVVTPVGNEDDISCTYQNDVPSGSNQLQPMTITQPTRFRVVGINAGASLITNGGFEDGNTGFSSDYVYRDNRTADGQYGITTNPQLWYPGINCTDCTDYPTAGDGRMLVADGSALPDQKIWSVKVPVIPYTTYAVSFWANAYDAPGNTSLDVFINNRLAGQWTSISASLWTSFEVLWNAGPADSLLLTIANASTSAPDNRFAIDEIGVWTYQVAEDSFNIGVQGSSQTIEASGDAGICPGGSTQLSVAGGADYTWSPAEGLSNVLIANPVASPLRTTRYYVRSGVAGSCAAIDSVLVTVIDPPSLQVTANTSVCAGNSVTLNASGGLTYEWTPAEGLSDPGVANPVATPDATTVYTVRSTGNGGCSAEASVEVTVTPKGKVYVPNAFTPNGDGLNDCFSVTGAAGATRFELSIYNRLGEKVFATSDPAACWDGRYKGVLQPSGTFVYYLNMESSCGPAKSKGTVMLIR